MMILGFWLPNIVEISALFHKEFVSIRFFLFEVYIADGEKWAY